MSEMNNPWDKFPDLRPIQHPPALTRINGIGTIVMGSRDPDPETGTYVTTLVVTAVFVPVLAVGASRVADAPGGGWYFVGMGGADGAEVARRHLRHRGGPAGPTAD